jgi:hypothetical protein
MLIGRDGVREWDDCERMEWMWLAILPGVDRVGERAL